MSNTVLVWLVVGVVVICLGVAALIVGGDIFPPRDEMRDATTRSDAQHTKRQNIAPGQQNSWIPPWTHAAPPRPFTVDAAHRVTQQHRGCLRDECPRKRAAWQTLVEARRVTPDSGREF
ncbi:hypothetical protein [Nocardia blacklockiae]|uniref:hypothetical protein n=1 Tax=Nocardia blacklockiae TaxID=480036 RepID=UPI0018942E72|nr:hypothetical protein [Nocardia blacklockiae]MBF6176126.1 hypothetical protein [Nocardia blacklockiae]